MKVNENPLSLEINLGRSFQSRIEKLEKKRDTKELTKSSLKNPL
jgi:hypothetical protein